MSEEVREYQGTHGGVPVIELIAFIILQPGIHVTVDTKACTVTLTSRNKAQKQILLDFAVRYGMANPVQASRHMQTPDKLTITINLGGPPVL